MPIKVTCSCGKTLTLPDEAAGKRGQCPACNAIVDVPMFGASEDAQAMGYKPIAPATTPPTRPFMAEVGLAFIYPLRKSGVILLLVGALLFTLCIMFSVGILTMFLGIFAWMYLAAYVLSVVQHSAGGGDTRPELPDLSDVIDDLVKPIFYMFAAALASYLPQIIYVITVYHNRGSLAESDLNGNVLTALSVYSAIYFPMAVMSVAIWRSAAAVSPHIVIPTIFKIPAQHLLMAAMVWLIWQGHGYADAHLVPDRTTSVMHFYAGLYVSNLLMIYFSIVVARIIGITHWVYRERIGWFRHT